MVERLPLKQKVAGSNPAPPANMTGWQNGYNASACKADNAGSIPAPVSSFCYDYGHRWELFGGMSCNCDQSVFSKYIFNDAGYVCSLPVNKCVICGDYDYGDNEEARKVKEACAFRDDRKNHPLTSLEKDDIQKNEKELLS